MVYGRCPRQRASLPDFVLKLDERQIHFRRKGNQQQRISNIPGLPEFDANITNKRQMHQNMFRGGNEMGLFRRSQDVSQTELLCHKSLMALHAVYWPKVVWHKREQQKRLVT